MGPAVAADEAAAARLSADTDGHLNRGIPISPSCWTAAAPGTPCIMGTPGSPPTSTPPPIPRTAATEILL